MSGFLSHPPGTVLTPTEEAQMADHPGSVNNPTPEQLERWGRDPDDREPPWLGDPRFDPDAIVEDREASGYYDDVTEEEYPRG